jgi:pimeloyl-ACP methyl ester carboxylesterase
MKARVNGVELEYQECGSGFPLIWAHEFGGSMESWEPQVHYFSRFYRVITYNARGYPPSEVPKDPAAYSQDIAVEDMHALLQHLGIERAFIGGLSMGASTSLHFGRLHPEMAAALIVASVGTGSTNPDEFRATSRALADRLESDPAAAFRDYALGPTRQQLLRKDPSGWQRFAELLAGHSPLGSALTMRGVQVGRPPIFDWEEQLAGMRVPALVLVGDEDEPCLEPSLFLKRCLPSCGLAVLPHSGHPINLEEPDLFNRLCLEFLSTVQAGRA